MAQQTIPVMVHKSMMTQSGPFMYPWNQVTFLNSDPTPGSYVLIDKIPLYGSIPLGAPAGTAPVPKEQKYSLNTLEVNTTKFEIDFSNSPAPNLFIVWTEYANQ